MYQSDFHYNPLTVSPLCCLVNLFPWLFYNKLNDSCLFIVSYLWSVRRQTHSLHHHWQHFILYPVKQNRFHVAMGLFSNRLQKASKCGKNIDDTLSCTLFVTFFVLTTLWCHLWSITVPSHSIMESICEIDHTLEIMFFFVPLVDSC